VRYNNDIRLARPTHAIADFSRLCADFSKKKKRKKAHTERHYTTIA
jgi:hypothetical protein